MRTKIDYGIYLGTTHCAIARMEDGIPVIIKTSLQMDSMPLCVAYDKRQNVLVGDVAFNVLKSELIRSLKIFSKGNPNVFFEFTRTLGTTCIYESSNLGRGLTSEELVAECFKALKSFVNDEAVESVVITVPAKFIYLQLEAVRKAGALAGFKHIELLQEPIAVAMSYGHNSGYENGYYVVFNFGVGTFEASLLKAEEGIFNLIDSEADNWLGGRNLDDAIVDQIIIPNLQQNYAIDSVLEDSDKREILRNAVKFFAEEAKIQLSFKDSHNILSNLGDLPFEDDNGVELEIDVELTQQNFKWIARPIFQKAVDMAIHMLRRNNLRRNEIKSILLVGGDTYSPILRKMLKEQITENVDMSVDPMTVVAKGAALFASTISVSDEVKENSRDKTKLQLDIKYEATTVETDEMVNIKVLKERSTGNFPDKVFAEVVRFDGAWSSGKKQISDKATIVDVLLVEGISNSFGINVYDEQGIKLECQPSQFRILQGIGPLDRMQVLPYHIGIGRYFETEGKELFCPVKGLEKNKRLPATGVINGFKTNISFRPGITSDVIRFPIYQGDFNAPGTPLHLNNHILDIVISGNNLPAMLPAGSDIDITLKVDRSQLLTVTAYIPALKHTEELAFNLLASDTINSQKIDDLKGVSAPHF